jgi:hypothetical protein
MSDPRPTQVCSRAWCFTLNNPDGQFGVEFPEILVPLRDKCVQLFVQLEKGESGTPHFQGYCRRKSASSLLSMKKLLPGAHFEPANGSPLDNYTYCTKMEGRECGPWIFGEKPKGQGKRTDLEIAAQLLSDGGSLRDLAIQHPTSFIKYNRGLSAYKKIIGRPRSERTVLLSYFGPTCSGKSTHALEIARGLASSDEDIFYLTKDMCHGNGIWWDGYDSHSVVVIEEFYGWMKLNSFLNLIDSTPLTVQTKGGSTHMVARWVITTSNDPPKDWYTNSTASDNVKAAFRRRLMEPFGFVNFVGYGPNMDLEYCPGCQFGDQCRHLKDVSNAPIDIPGSGMAAFAGGYLGSNASPAEPPISAERALARKRMLIALGRQRKKQATGR